MKSGEVTDNGRDQGKDGNSAQSRGQTWTVDALLRASQTYLAKRDIASARLDAELLLCQVLGRDRIYLYTHYDQPVTAEERDALRPLLRRRGEHVPMAYLRGTQAFYGLDFEVTPDVLIPRPETEHVVEAALAWCAARKLAAPVVADIGTGSGAIAIALATALPEATVWATDSSAAAVAVARRNVARHNLSARVQVVHADLFAPIAAHGAAEPAGLPERFDAVLSNPPYVCSGDALPKTVVAYEPHAALYAGTDGLDVVRPLIAAAAERLRAPGLLALEVAPEQMAALRTLLATHFAGVHTLPDLAGHQRVAVGWRGEGTAADLHLPLVPPVRAALAGEAGAGAAEAAGPQAAPDVQLDDPELARD